MNREPELIARVVARDTSVTALARCRLSPRSLLPIAATLSLGVAIGRFSVRAPNASVEGDVSRRMTVTDIIKIYDETTDPQMKDAVISALVDSGDKVATDKLMLIARNDENPSMRRKAISVLGRSSDERVKKFLSDMAVK